jgi:HK97 family phage portal protein
VVISLFEGLKKILFRGGSGQKQTQTMGTILKLYIPGNAVWTPKNYEALAREGYQSNVYVFACVNIIAKACAGIPWGLYDTGKTLKTMDMVSIPRDARRSFVKRYVRHGRLKELDNHEVLSLLAKPNPIQAHARFFESMIGFLLLAGNEYIEGVGPVSGANAGRFQELYPWRPDRVKVVTGQPNEPVQAYRYSVGNYYKDIAPDYVLHLKLFNPLDDFYGMSPIQAAAKSIDQNNASKAWNVSLLQNSGRPSGAFKSKTNVDDKQYNRLQAWIDEEVTGTINAGRPILLEGDLDWTQMGLDAVDMAWIEGQKLSAKEIAIAYNVAPELIGDQDNKTYSNYKEAREALYMETVLPLMDWIRDEINVWLIQKWGPNLYLDYDRDDIEALQEDRDKLWNRAIRAVRGGLLTPNEGREIIGYESYPGADDLITTQGGMPIGGVGDDIDRINNQDPYEELVNAKKVVNFPFGVKTSQS